MNLYLWIENLSKNKDGIKTTSINTDRNIFNEIILINNTFHLQEYTLKFIAKQLLDGAMNAVECSGKFKKNILV